MNDVVRTDRTDLVTQDSNTVDGLIAELKHVKEVLTTTDAATIVPGIEKAHRLMQKRMDLLSEQARVALLDARRYGSEVYENAFALISEKMGEFHDAVEALLEMIDKRSQEAFTQVDNLRFVHDIGAFLHQQKIGQSTIVEKSEGEMNWSNPTFGKAKPGKVEMNKNVTMLDRFLKAFKEDFADYIILYVIVLDKPERRKNAITTIVDKVEKGMGVALPKEDKVTFIEKISDFATSIRNKKNPYTLKAGEGVINGTLPEVVKFDAKNIKGSTQEWMKNRATMEPKNGKRNGKKSKKDEVTAIVEAKTAEGLTLPPIIEAGPDFVEGVMYLYWNNGEVEEASLQTPADKDAMVAAIEKKVKDNEKLPLKVNGHFYDKHALEQSFLLLPRGESMHLRLKGTDKVCRIVRMDDGSLEVRDFGGNPPEELADVTQEKLLEDPYRYFSVKGIGLDEKYLQ